MRIRLCRVAWALRASAAPWAAVDREGLYEIVAAIGMRDHLGMNVFEATLHADGFGLGDQRAALAAGSGFDQGRARYRPPK